MYKVAIERARGKREVSDGNSLGEGIHVRGLSPLGLQAPVEGSQLGGGVATLSTLCPSVPVPLSRQSSHPRPPHDSQDSSTTFHHFPQLLVGNSTDGAFACGKIGYHIVGTECATWSDVYHCPISNPIPSERRRPSTHKDGVPCIYKTSDQVKGPSVSSTAPLQGVSALPLTGRCQRCTIAMVSRDTHHFSRLDSLLDG
jgi:hypothetical protein